VSNQDRSTHIFEYISPVEMLNVVFVILVCNYLGGPHVTWPCT